MNILNKLTIKHLKMNKKRTVVTIIGVILSTALMVGIGLLFSSVRDNSIKTIILRNGPQHVTLKKIEQEKLEIIQKNVKVKSVTYLKDLGYARINHPNDSNKPFVEVMAGSKEFLGNLNLLSGRLPKNNTEIVIPDHLKNSDYQIGKQVTLDIGLIPDYPEEAGDYEKWLSEQLQETNLHRTYTVVGVVKRSYTESYDNFGFQVFTLDQEKASKIDAFVIFKNPKDTYKISEILAQNTGMESIVGLDGKNYHTGIVPNNALLSLSGVSHYQNITNSMSSVIFIILSLISIGCIVVIYNSFAISVMERKKQFGLFASIGATKAQLRKTVFFEAVLIGVIGIPLGLLGSLVGIGIVIEIINWLLPDVFSVSLSLSVYPLFIWIPILFMIAVILISAYLPAKRASRITPIEAIRQNDDIKVRKNKIKANRFVRKFFGIEGELAYKNMERNKKKYRITIVSLFISIVLFISFSSILYYGFTSALDVSNLPNYDMLVDINDEDEKKIDTVIDTFKNHEQIDDIVIAEILSYQTSSMNLSHYQSKFMEKVQLQLNQFLPVDLIHLDSKSYEAYKKQLGLKKDQPIVINYGKGTIYENQSRITLKTEKYRSFPTELNLCIYNYKEEVSENSGPQSICNWKIDDFYLTTQYPIGLDDYIGIEMGGDQVAIVIPDSIYRSLDYKNQYEQVGNHISSNKRVYIKAKQYNDLDKVLKQLNNQTDAHVSYVNIQEDMKLMKNLVLVVKILLYGFIALVTLIGVTSVFNTINTSINLRRKEFAMLRSMGLTPHGFNKILYFESFFVGLKSLLYGVPVALFVTYLLWKAFSGMSEQTFVISFDSIGITILGVFLIVIITMKYASSKIKKENILDAIREENI